ncbi:hypothetical protein WP5W18E02_21100 [Aeromonas caviae]|nr:hypothetical protein WP5W18E02_21100 [Aeromonas caviae]
MHGYLRQREDEFILQDLMKIYLAVFVQLNGLISFRQFFLVCSFEQRSVNKTSFTKVFKRLTTTLANQVDLGMGSAFHNGQLLDIFAKVQCDIHITSQAFG